MENIIEKARGAIEEHLQLILRKSGNMHPTEIELLTKDICALEALKRLESGDEGAGNSYRRGRSPMTGRYVSRDSHDSGNSGSHYGDGASGEQFHDGASTRRYYDGTSTRGSYSGHSIQDRMVDCLERMMDEAQTEHERETVNQWIKRLKN